MKPSIDLGDLCLTCGASTAPGSGLFVNRIDAGRDFDSLAPALQATHAADTDAYFSGWYCSNCQVDDCEACQAEIKSEPFDASDYIGATGFLCDEHTGVVVCTVCDEAVEDEEEEVVVSADGWELRHATCDPLTTVSSTGVIH